ncbi:MAG: MFS transporter [Saprospiraceae bacterium]
MINSFKSLIRNSYSGLSKEIWLLALLTLINRTGSMVILFMTIYLTTELNFSMTEAGIAMSCFGAGSVVGAYGGGFLTDRIGYYKTMFLTLFGAGLLFFVLMQMTTFYEFCAMVFIVSSVADGFRPASMASISAYAKPDNHNRSLSLIRLAINLGFAGGAAVTGFISAAFGYKALFIIDGTTCILASFFLLLALKPKEEVVEKSKSEDNLVDGKGPSAYKDATYLQFIGFKMISAIVFMQLFSTVPVFLKDVLQFTEQEFGLIMMANGIIIVVLEMPVVYLLESRFNKMTLVIIGYAMIASGFLVLGFAELAVAAVVIYYIVAISVGELVAFPFSNAFALSRSTPGRRGEFMGLYSMGFSIAFIIAPLLGMWIAESFGFSILWWSMTGLGLVGVFGFVLTKTKIDAEEPVKEEVLDLV